MRIPTLEEALAVMPSNIWLNVHIKGGRELGEAVARVIKKEKRLRQAFLACEEKAAEGARQAVPQIMICIGVSADERRCGYLYHKTMMGS